MKAMNFDMIVARAGNGVIGCDGALPWGRIAADMAFFRRYTLDRAVIMGRHTMGSIGCALPRRWNVALSRNPPGPDWVAGVRRVATLDEAHALAVAEGYELPVIIGGQQVYELALPYTVKLVVVEIPGVYEGDAFFPDGWLARFREVGRQELGEWPEGGGPLVARHLGAR